VASSLADKKYPLILSYTSENVTKTAEMSKIVLVYFQLLGWMKEHHVEASLSVRLSQFDIMKHPVASSLQSFRITFLKEILEKAKKQDVRVWIDAEELEFRQNYFMLLDNLWEMGYTNIGRVLQANGKSDNWEKIVTDIARKPMPTRICKGAYRKTSNVAHSFKDSYNKILSQFSFAVWEFLGKGSEVEVATHDPKIIGTFNSKLKLNIHFAMLYGINTAKAKELKITENNPHIYILFGPHWAQYIIRRLIENPEYLLLPFKEKNHGPNAY